MHFETAIGTCAVRWSERGITGVWLPGRLPQAQAEAPAGVLAAVEAIVALLAGEPRDLREVALDETGVDEFRRRVYAATRAVGPGETASYGEIARALGQPEAVRAVGAALGANPFPIVVPCHRVLGGEGSLQGFSAPGGLATKGRMLEYEHAPGFTQVALFTLS
jgi:methylated-DNA-[protein]-cysteine S-methyltransferase